MAISEMYAIWLLPTQHDMTYLINKIDNICQEYGTSRFVPHITIYGVVDTDLTILEECVKYAIYEITPFKVRKKDLQHSDNLWKAIYLDIESNHNLDNIYEKLSQKLSQYSNYQFTPHISLIYKKLDICERQKIIKETEIKNEFTIDKIAILEFSENVNEWRILSSFTF